MTSTDVPAAGASPPSLLGWPFTVLPWWAKAILAVVTIAGIATAGWLASESYPYRQTTSRGTALEAQIAEVMRDPTVKVWDDALIGDFLVERFYILDMATGDRYVADFLKGRIDGVEVIQREDQSPANVFLLTTKDMRRNKSLYDAYFRRVSNPSDAADAFYLGVITPTGNSDAFPVNYNGDVPTVHLPFQAGGKSDVFEFMFSQNFKDITAPRGFSVANYTHVLSSSDIFPLFRNEYKLEKTMFVSELLVIDATARANKTVLFTLMEQFPRAGQ